VNLLATLAFLSVLGQYQQVTVHDIQYTTDPAGNSPLNGQRVVFTGVVTASPDQWIRTLQGFFVQDGEGPWTGVYVYTGNYTGPLPALAPGDSVQVWGTVAEYNGLTEISPLDSVKILRRGVPLPSAHVIGAGHLCTGCDSAEAYEGVLVQVEQITVSNPSLGFGEWEITDASGATRVDDAAGYAYTPVLGDALVAVRGVQYFAFNEFKIEPRGDGDIFKTDAAGSGEAWIDPAGWLVADTGTFVLYVRGSVPDTLKALRVVLPTGGQLVQTPTLGGAFAGGALTVQGDTLSLQAVQLLKGDTGWIRLVWITPSQVGDALLEVSSADSAAFRLIQRLGIQLFTMDGSGTAQITPTQLTLDQAVDLSMRFSLNLPAPLPGARLSGVQVTLHGAYAWSGNVQLLGAFSSAQVQSTLTDSTLVVTLTGLSLQDGDTGELLLNGVVPLQAPGSRSVDVASWGPGGTPTPIAGSPLGLVVVPRLDTVLPLRVFHDPALEPLLVGQSVRVRGRVTAVLTDKVYLQDGTGGVVLYRPSGAFAEGDSVEVTGTYAPYRNLAEITPATLESTLVRGLPLNPDVHPIADIGESLEGMLVRLPAVVVTGNRTLSEGTRTTVQDPSGTLSLYAERGSNLNGVTLPPDSIAVIGVIEQRDTFYQILPRRPEDLIPLGDGAGTFRFAWPFVTSGVRDSVDLLITVAAGSLGTVVVEWDTTQFSPSGYRLIGPGWGGVPAADLEDTLVGGRVRLTFYRRALAQDTLRFYQVRVDTTQPSIPLTVATARDSVGVPQQVLVAPALYPVRSLGWVQEPGPDGDASAHVGDTVTVGGVVVGPSSAFSGGTLTSLYLQDSTGGINVFAPFALPPVDTGELMVVRGVITEYQNLTEIFVASSADLHRVGRAAVPAPRTLSRNQGIGEALEGMLIRVDTGVVGRDPYLSGQGWTFPVWNGQAVVQVYVYPATGAVPRVQQLRKGDLVRVTGIAGQYGATYQLLPRDTADLILLTLTPHQGIQLSVRPSVVAFELGERLNITVQAPADAEVSVTVHDVAGRKVAHVLRRAVGPQQFLWDGMTDAGRRAPAGIYLLHARIRLADGTLKDLYRTFVIGIPR